MKTAVGIAIGLNRPVLLLQHAESQRDGPELPECLESISDRILKFSGDITLKDALEKSLPDWVSVPPARDWLNRYCIFGERRCEYRGAHPLEQHWEREKLHCHVSDGEDLDRPDFRGVIEHVLGQYADVTVGYLDQCSIADSYDYLLCSYCQTVRSTPFAIYRITS